MDRRRIDFDAIRRDLDGRCFICELVAGNPEFAHHIVYEDERTVAFLNKYPAVYGYVLVAPRAYRLDLLEAELANLAERLRAALVPGR